MYIDEYYKRKTEERSDKKRKSEINEDYTRDRKEKNKEKNR